MDANILATLLFLLGLFVLASTTFGVFHGVRIGLRSRQGDQRAAHFSLPITILLVFGIIGFVFLSPSHPDSSFGMYVSLFIGKP